MKKLKKDMAKLSEIAYQQGGDAYKCELNRVNVIKQGINNFVGKKYWNFLEANFLRR